MLFLALTESCSHWLNYIHHLNGAGWAFLSGSNGKESVCCAGDQGLIPGLGRSPGEEIKTLGESKQCVLSR